MTYAEVITEQAVQIIELRALVTSLQAQLAEALAVKDEPEVG